MWHIEVHTSYCVSPEWLMRCLEARRGMLFGQPETRESAAALEPTQVQQAIADWLGPGGMGPHHSDWLEVYEEGILVAVVWAAHGAEVAALELFQERQDCVLPDASAWKALTCGMGAAK